MKILEVVEQDAIFDGGPEFPPLSMAIYLMNHYSYGGTPSEFEQAKLDSDLERPRRYRVRLTLEYEEIQPDSKKRFGFDTNEQEG